MKRSLALVVALGLVVVGSAPVHAKKPQSVQLFLHGTEQFGEIDMVNNFAARYFSMDTTEPTDAAPKSVMPPAWSGVPWNDCAGMYILPVWTAPMSGKIAGELKVTLHTIAPPRPLEVQIYADVVTQTCASNELSEGEYPEPVATAQVTPAGGLEALEIVFEDVKFTAKSMLMLQLRPAGGPYGGRILYDASDYASSVEFSCTPLRGKSCI